ncbi:D-alanyl-D-alanine carboxypeptidase family protein [Cellulomonas shaoxiangyii]|uniref:D-alanyl-D-alanine carboxypeptidase family protein n=1 Tax=Cellulomonas shaoxiangyii TaxID=2566013 RepID=UPI001408409D|nr:D-alanyl-D-alanine carboxypeptidase family protein [Cellulomonas shaoxiangyii]
MRPSSAAVLAVPLAAVLVVAAGGPAAAGPGEDVLRGGETLVPGQALVAPGGAHTLLLQPDGSLGLYGLDGAVRWSSGRGVPGSTVRATESGDVEAVAPDGTVVWRTGTAVPGGVLQVREDGDLVVVDGAGTVAWESGTAQEPASLSGPVRLAPGDVLSSPDGLHNLFVLPDVGVQLMGPDGTVRWAPGVDGTEAAGAAPGGPAVALELRRDGNLVAVDADGTWLWRSRTAGQGGTTLSLRDDGTLALLAADGAPVWSSGAPIGPAELGPGAELAAGASLGSPSGHLRLEVAGGALVASFDGDPLWTSGTTTGVTLRLQDDGDLVLLDAAGAPVWGTGTAGRPGARLALEETAVVLVGPVGEVLWQVAVPEGRVPSGAAPAGGVPSGAVPTDCGLVDGPVAQGDTVVTSGGIRVHPCLAPAVDALVEAARADGIELGGGGWRSAEQQIALRRAHCGPTDWHVYEAPASSCSPSTAPPGSSRHERGLAIDFTAGGRTLGAGSAGYTWLVEHAADHGLENLPGEPWHWSVDGR